MRWARLIHRFAARVDHRVPVPVASVREDATAGTSCPKRCGADSNPGQTIDVRRPNGEIRLEPPRRQPAGGEGDGGPDDCRGAASGRGAGVGQLKRRKPRTGGAGGGDGGRA